jgi:hypothetical protein
MCVVGLADRGRYEQGNVSLGREVPGEASLRALSVGWRHQRGCRIDGGHFGKGKEASDRARPLRPVSCEAQSRLEPCRCER